MSAWHPVLEERFGAVGLAVGAEYCYATRHRLTLTVSGAPALGIGLSAGDGALHFWGDVQSDFPYTYFPCGADVGLADLLSVEGGVALGGRHLRTGPFGKAAAFTLGVGWAAVVEPDPARCVLEARRPACHLGFEVRGAYLAYWHVQAETLLHLYFRK